MHQPTKYSVQNHHWSRVPVMYQIQSHPTPVSITDQSDNSVLTASRLLQYSNAYSQYLSLLEDQNINFKQYHEIYIFHSQYIYIFHSLKRK